MTAEDARGGVRSRSFLGLLATQFLVALNDNMLRWLVVPIGKSLAPNNEGLVLSAGLACFVMPYIVLAAPAGYLADRFSKRAVIVRCKAAEIAIMILAVEAILIGEIYFMFVVVAVMGAQSALFSPSKLGSIPEIVRADRLSAANGLFGLTTVVAIVLGAVAGGYLYHWTTLGNLGGLMVGRHRCWISATVLIGVAVVGWLVSLLIRPRPAANPTQSFPLNAVGQTYRDLAALASRRPLLLAALGSAFFWWLGSLANLNVDLFAKKELLVQQQHVGPLLAMLALGVGLGSALAGRLSAGKIELGIVPVGAAGMAAFAMLLYTVPEGTGEPWSAPYNWACFWLLLVGISGGLYDIPLLAFLQHESPTKSRGAIMAAYNFLVFSGILAVAGVFWLLHDQLGWSARYIFLLAGILTVPVVLIVIKQMPLATTRFALWVISRLMYRVRVYGMENFPEKGGALLAPNHVSYADGLLLALSCPRHVRFVVYADYFEGWWVRWCASPKMADVIKIKPGKRSVVQSIRAAREALRKGDVVCIFPEGGVTRTGQMQEFRPGFLSALKDTGAPVIPVYLEGLWGSIFSFEGGKVFWKWPRRWPYPVTIRFGRPIAEPTDTEQVRQAVASLGEK